MGRKDGRTDGWKEGQMDGQTDGQTDEQTTGTDEIYIPLWHTSYAGGIKSYLPYKTSKNYHVYPWVKI